MVLISSLAISADAADPAKTSVSVNKGDEVVYALKLTTPKKVVGCDFSIYFDSSKLKVKEVADFTGNFDSEQWQAVINPNLKDQVIGNWSILSGVSFDNRAMCTIKFEATAKCDTNISYYVRYMYPENMEQFTDYTFKCDVTVNKNKVVNDKAPELNTEIQQSQGKFINSVTGDGKDADVNMAKPKTNNSNKSNGGELNEDNVDNKTTTKTDKNTDKSDDKSDSKSSKTEKADDKKSDKKTESTKATKADEKKDDDETSVAEQKDISVAATDNADANTDDVSGSIFTSIWFWILVALVAVGGGFAGFYFVKKKKTNS